MAFPTTGIVDNFNRTENPLSDGGQWNAPLAQLGVGVFRINGSEALYQGSDISAMDRDVGSGADQEAYITMTVAPSTATNVDVFVRTTGANTTWSGYEFFVNSGTGGWAIRRITNAATTTLASGTIAAGGLSAGDQVGMSVIGSTLRGYVNGVEVGSASDSTYSAHGKIGWASDPIATTDTAIRFDNFGGGDVVAGSTFDDSVTFAVTAGYSLSNTADLEASIVHAITAGLALATQADLSPLATFAITAGFSTEPDPPPGGAVKAVYLTIFRRRRR